MSLPHNYSTTVISVYVLLTPSTTPHNISQSYVFANSLPFEAPMSAMKRPLFIKVATRPTVRSKLDTHATAYFDSICEPNHRVFCHLFQTTRRLVDFSCPVAFSISRDYFFELHLVSRTWGSRRTHPLTHCYAILL
jgi:hypothetical protein